MIIIQKPIQLIHFNQVWIKRSAKDLLRLKVYICTRYKLFQPEAVLFHISIATADFEAVEKFNSK